MANEQQQTPAAPDAGQSRGSEQARSGRAKLTGRPESDDFDFDAFAEGSSSHEERYNAEADKFQQERRVEEAANRGITLEPETPAEPAPAAEAAPAEDAATTETPRPSDRFKSDADARTGYDNLMTLQARQAEELGQLRGVAARHEAEKVVRAEVAAQHPQPQPGQPAQQQNDPRHLAYQRAVQFQKERYGLDDQEAEIAAQEMIGLVDYVASNRVEQAAARVRPMVERFEGEQELQQRVNRVALEADTQGQPVRPDWQEVTMSEEFAQVVKAEPDLIKSDLGLRHAYQTAKYMQTASPKAMADEADRLKAEARKVVDTEKARAASASSPSVPDSGPDDRSEDQQAMDGMFEVDSERHFMQGGSRGRR